ncbi:MAG: hypothetical protein HC836_31280 [Richelia sp. RM2_1_2]|nr:hypothetical protein [Richelia sp. RM2_1_2]
MTNKLLKIQYSGVCNFNSQEAFAFDVFECSLEHLQVLTNWMTIQKYNFHVQRIWADTTAKTDWLTLILFSAEAATHVKLYWETNN